MAFDDSYRESIQTKHIANVGFTSTAKGVTNEAYALKNPHQVLASQIPAVDVVATYGPLTADGITANMVEQHTVKLTADPTVNGNKAWIATEDNCTETGHAARGEVRIDQWMRYAETQYKLRLFEDNGTGTAPNMSAEILPSETSFNWEYDASAGIVYFDEDPSANGKTLPLWGVLFTYVGQTVAESISTTTSGLSAHTHVEADITDLDKYTQAEVDSMVSDLSTEISTASGVLQTQIDNLDNTYATDSELGTAVTNLTTVITTASGYLQDQIDALDTTYATDAELAAVSGTLQSEIDANSTTITNNYNTLSGLISDLDAELSTASGVLQTQIDALDNTYATDAELSAVSGTLQSQIDALDSVYATDAELAVVSGTLQSQIDTNATSITNNYNTLSGLISDLDAELSTASGVLQSEIDSLTTTVSNNYTTLDSKIDTTSGTLQSEIDALDVSLTSAIIWEVVDTPFEQIRPKVEHQGKAIYTAGNLTIGGDLTVSGTTTTIHSQELTVTDKIITVNAGEVGAGVTGSQYAGIEVDRGSEGTYMFVFDEVQDNFRVGISGSLQAVATREDDPTDQYVAFWNAAANRFDTAGGIAVGDIASQAYVTSAIATVSGALQSDIDAAIADLANNYYNKTEIDAFNTDIYSTITSTSGVLQDQIDQNASDISSNYASLSDLISDNYSTLNTKIDTTSGTLQSQIDLLSGGVSDNYYTKTEVDAQHSAIELEILTASGVLQNQIDSNDTDIANNASAISSVASDLATNYYTSTAIDSMLAGQNEFLELTDVEIASYTAERVLFTTASGVTDDTNFTYDSATGTLSALYIDLELGGAVNEVVTTVTSGTTDLQIPTAKAVWDLTEAAAAAVHIHYDVDAVYVSDTSWTYGTAFAAVPEGLMLFVNGVKQRIGADYDCTVDVPGGVLMITFNYSVRTTDWVNVTYYV